MSRNASASCSSAAAALNADIYNNSLKRKRAAFKPGSGRISQMTKWKQGVLERERLKKASVDTDDDVQEIISVVNPEAINPESDIVEGAASEARENGGTCIWNPGHCGADEAGASA